METFEQIMGIISRFITNSILPWSVVVLVVAIIFRKSIAETIGRLINIKGFGFKFSFFSIKNKKIGKEITAVEKKIKQINSKSLDSLYTDNNPEIVIPCIYAKIETALKEKFGETESYNMFDKLYEDKKIDSGTFIILDSMRSLRDDIHTVVLSQKITRKDIENYEHNAERIISIIKNIES